MSTEENRVTWKDGALVVLVLACCLAMIWWYRPGVPVQAEADRRAEPLVPSEALALDGLPIKGDARAPLALMQFSEFQCPFCGVFARETLPALERRYVDTGIIRIVFRHLPLETIHPLAVQAAQAAVCAGRSNRFWEMHDALFREQERLDAAGLRERAEALGLPAEAFETCLTSVPVDVRRDMLLADRLGMRSTPVSLLGRILPDGRLKVVRVITGARPLDEFVAAIEDLRAKGTE